MPLCPDQSLQRGGTPAAVQDNWPAQACSAAAGVLWPRQYALSHRHLACTIYRCLSPRKRPDSTQHTAPNCSTGLAQNHTQSESTAALWFRRSQHRESNITSGLTHWNAFDLVKELIGEGSRMSDVRARADNGLTRRELGCFCAAHQTDRRCRSKLGKRSRSRLILVNLRNGDALFLQAAAGFYAHRLPP